MLVVFLFFFFPRFSGCLAFGFLTVVSFSWVMWLWPFASSAFTVRGFVDLRLLVAVHIWFVYACRYIGVWVCRYLGM